MSEEFKTAKATYKAYSEGVKHSVGAAIPSLEQILILMDEYLLGTGDDKYKSLLKAKQIIEGEIRRLKGLPF